MKAFIPGTDEQLKFLLENLDVKDMQVCIFGSNSEYAADELSKKVSAQIELIVEDHDSFINSKLVLKGNDRVNLRVMSFENTDFPDNSFDLVYAQASISGSGKARIVKEVKRILKPEGYLCAGEIVSLIKDAPRFMKDIWMQSGIVPLLSGELINYYEERNFKLLFEVDLSRTLKEFYSMSHRKLADIQGTLTDGEKSYYKKLLARISHESNAYLKLGGNKYMGFKSLLLQKQ